MQFHVNVAEKIRKFDAYPKTLEDFRIKTFGGAAVTIISSILMITLFISELKYYLTPEVTEELFVDVSRDAKLKINFDVIVSRISCSFLSIDSMDVSGEQQINVTHNIYKRRLDLNGKPIDKPEKEEKIGDVSRDIAKLITSTLSPDRCESCYGAESELNKCCNTCDDVKDAYRLKGWAFEKPENIEQCLREGWKEKLKYKDTEGCQVSGYIEVNRVSGNLHIAPGHSFSQHHVHVHDLDLFSSSEFNLTHKIRHLSFGRSIPGKSDTLDGNEEIALKGATMFQYYIKIVPTTYVKQDGQTFSSSMFAVTKHNKQVGGLTGESGLPGIFFIYEFAPMMIAYTERTRSFLHFLTNVCAIVGGVFTVAGLVDAFIYHSARAIQKKMELGKAS